MSEIKKLKLKLIDCKNLLDDVFNYQVMIDAALTVNNTDLCLQILENYQSHLEQMNLEYKRISSDSRDN